MTLVMFICLTLYEPSLTKPDLFPFVSLNPENQPTNIKLHKPIELLWF